jgi:membrane protease subunit HflK
MYLEAMSKVYPKLGKVFIMDSEQKNILPLINLDTMTKAVSPDTQENNTQDKNQNTKTKRGSQ